MNCPNHLELALDTESQVLSCGCYNGYRTTDNKWLLY